MFAKTASRETADVVFAAEYVSELLYESSKTLLEDPNYNPSATEQEFQLDVFASVLVLKKELAALKAAQTPKTNLVDRILTRIVDRRK